MTTVDLRLAALAADQHGLITFDQALAAGLGRQQIKRRVATGRWNRLERGIYLLAGVPTTPPQRALAACLAAPDGAVTSHLTAAALAGLSVAHPPTPHLTVGRGRSTRLPGAVVHRARLTVTDITTLEGVPATTVGRTLIDCAALFGPNRLQRVVDEALHRNLVRPDQIAGLWDHARLRPGRAGEVRLREAIEPWSGPIKPGSPPETRLRRQLMDWGYPEPELQILIRADDGTVIARADLGWSPRKIGVEYDSSEWHGPSRWISDSQRQERIEAVGWTLLRADKADLRPGERSLRDALAQVWSGVSV